MLRAISALRDGKLYRAGILIFGERDNTNQAIEGS